MAQKLFENKDLRVLFDAAKDATPEDLETTYNMLMALRKRNVIIMSFVYQIFSWTE